MISKRWLDLRRAAGLPDADLVTAWQAFEAEAIAWPNASQIAVRFGRSRQTGATWCRKGLFERGNIIGAVKVDGVWRVNPAVLEGFTPPVEGEGAGKRKEQPK
jgi:hypothetical protein